jgi:hypothetical protein
VDRRSFLKGFTAVMGAGLVYAPSSALAQVARLGTPQEWVDGEVLVEYYRINSAGDWTLDRVALEVKGKHVQGFAQILDVDKVQMFHDVDNNFYGSTIYARPTKVAVALPRVGPLG